MDEELLYTNAIYACDKHEIRGVERDKVLKWIGDALIRHGLLISILNKRVEISGLTPDGQDVMFTLTEEGKSFVKKSFTT